MAFHRRGIDQRADIPVVVNDFGVEIAGGGGQPVFAAARVRLPQDGPPVRRRWAL